MYLVMIFTIITKIKAHIQYIFNFCLVYNSLYFEGEGEVMFGEVVGRVSGVAAGRAREGVALLLSGRLMRCVLEWKEVSSRLMWVRVKIERESLVFISAYVGCLYRRLYRHIWTG